MKEPNDNLYLVDDTEMIEAWSWDEVVSACVSDAGLTSFFIEVQTLHKVQMLKVD